MQIKLYQRPIHMYMRQDETSLPDVIAIVKGFPMKPSLRAIEWLSYVITPL